MKILTTNFLTCAIKSCKSSPASFPLHPQDVTLASTPLDFSAEFLLNILPRLNYDALLTVATALSLQALLPEREVFEGLAEGAIVGEEGDEEGVGGRDEVMLGAEGDGQGQQVVAVGEEEREEVLKRLHRLLLETNIQEGKLVCGNCGFEYPVKEGVGNFLLPSHLV